MVTINMGQSEVREINIFIQLQWKWRKYADNNPWFLKNYDSSIQCVFTVCVYSRILLSMAHEYTCLSDMIVHLHDPVMFIDTESSPPEIRGLIYAPSRITENM